MTGDEVRNVRFPEGYGYDRSEVDDQKPVLRQLLDETGTPILYTGGTTSGQASGYIKFPGRRWLRFPVQGSRRAKAVMTAVDQAGKKTMVALIEREGVAYIHD